MKDFVSGRCGDYYRKSAITRVYIEEDSRHWEKEKYVDRTTYSVCADIVDNPNVTISQRFDTEDEAKAYMKEFIEQL